MRAAAARSAAARSRSCAAFRRACALVGKPPTLGVALSAGLCFLDLPKLFVQSPLRLRLRALLLEGSPLRLDEPQLALTLGSLALLEYRLHLLDAQPALLPLARPRLRGALELGEPPTIEAAARRMARTRPRERDVVATIQSSLGPAGQYVPWWR